MWTAYRRSVLAQENDTEQEATKEGIWLDKVCLSRLNVNKAMNESMSSGKSNGALSLGGDGIQVMAVRIVVAVVEGLYLL